jgi:hypothetical protein
VSSQGTLEVHTLAGSNIGTVTSTGMTIEATRFGVTCRYRTENTHIGALTGSIVTGSTATIDLIAAIPFHSGHFLCGEGPTTTTGSLSIGTPDYLDVDPKLGDIPTSPAGTTYEGKFHASSEGYMVIDNPIATINCNLTLEGEAKPQGSGKPIGVPLGSLTFSGCTNSWHVTVVSPGTLSIDSITDSKNGTVTWTGATIDMTRFGVTCRYKAENTDIGTLTGSKATGGTATIDLSGTLPVHSGSSFLCGETSHTLTGSLSVGTPDYLDVDAEFGELATSPAGTLYEGSLHATSEGHVVIDNPIAKIECSLTLEGEAKPGSAGKPVSVPLGSLAFSGCTNSWHLTVISNGTLEISWIAGTNNGTVKSSGMTIEATRFGVTCRYRTENTDIGTLTGSKATGATATIDLSVALPFHSGNFLCGEGATTTTGSLSVGTPDYLDIDPDL